MHKHSGLFRAVLLFLTAAPVVCLAVDTHIWEQSEQADFARGTAKKLSIRSDGHVTLSPEFKELDSTTVPYLWALAEDSKGTVYYGGGAPTGNTAKIFAVSSGHKAREFADLVGLEIHALAVDSQDRVYAAVLPDAKIYRIDEHGKPQIFFDAKCKYIWSMAFDRSGNLFVATGDAGIIYKVSPDGKGTKFFDTGETHARSMIFDRAGNLIVGTEPSGLILRVSPKGEGFVLFQANKREVTALAERNGFIYATAVGNKPASLVVTGAAPVLPASQPPVTSTGAKNASNPPPALPPAIGSLSASISGGTELYRIEKDGFAEKLWGSATDIAYAIAFDSSGRPLIATGNRGLIYRVDSDQLSTELLNMPPTQVTAFLQSKDNLVYAVTGNVGNLYSIGPGMESSGTLESDVLDASEFAYWGKAHVTSALHGGSIAMETRSGNLNHPESHWSEWSRVSLSELGGPIQSPPSRFLQYRLTFTKSGSGDSPDLSLIDIAYLPKNVAPKILQIEIAPANYRQAPSNSSIERTIMPSGSPAMLTLPAVGQKRAGPVNPSEAAAGATLQYSKGYITVRWSATDVNADPLIFKVEIKGKEDAAWRLLKEKLQDRYYSFDSAAFSDGSYMVRVTASDAPGNTPENALTSSLESDSFNIDNTPPEILNANVTNTGGKRTIRFTAKDALSWIDKSEYSINGGEWIVLEPMNKVTDSQSLNYELQGEEGQFITVRIFDEIDNVVVKHFPL